VALNQERFTKYQDIPDGACRSEGAIRNPHVACLEEGRENGDEDGQAKKDSVPSLRRRRLTNKVYHVRLATSHLNSLESQLFISRQEWEKRSGEIPVRRYNCCRKAEYTNREKKERAYRIRAHSCVSCCSCDCPSQRKAPSIKEATADKTGGKRKDGL
jgi:hypothetical protein